MTGMNQHTLSPENASNLQAARKSCRAKFQKVALRALDGVIRCESDPGLVGD
jgi:hypothetical protein